MSKIFLATLIFSYVPITFHSGQELRKQMRWMYEEVQSPHGVKFANANGPFEQSNDEWYRTENHRSTLMTKLVKYKQKMGIEIEKIDQKFDEDFVVVWEAERLKTESGLRTPSIKKPSPPDSFAAQLRTHLGEIRESALRTIEAMDRLEKTSDSELTEAMDDIVFGIKKGEALEEVESSVVNDIEQALCSVMKLETQKQQEEMIQALLKSVGKLMTFPVTLEEIRGMHDIVRFVDKFHGKLIAGTKLKKSKNGKLYEVKGSSSSVKMN